MTNIGFRLPRNIFPDCALGNQQGLTILASNRIIDQTVPICVREFSRYLRIQITSIMIPTHAGRRPVDLLVVRELGLTDVDTNPILAVNAYLFDVDVVQFQPPKSLRSPTA